MGEPKKKTLSTILAIAEACAIIDQNEALDSTTAYRIGRLASATEGPSKIYNRERNKLIKSLRDEMEGKNQDEKAKLNNEFNIKLEALLDQEEEIAIPELKLAFFTAKKKMKVKDREYEEGQVLVPQKFFNLMGELITE